MKINMKELAHYIVGGLVLIVSTPILMQWFPVASGAFDMNYVSFSAAWILEYIIVDQILHVVIKHEKISIVK